MEKTLQFTVDSALLRELGEKLVESVHLALSELVKNAYDADATEVQIIFESNKSGIYRLKIIDNGTGMNFEAVQKYWMRIATTNKERENTSVVYGRYLTGAKGIGRFSCRRLGTKLTLITNGTQEGNVVGLQKNIERTEVVFPWTKFEVGTDVTEIKCPGEQTEIDEAETGTTLIIDGVTDEWTRRGFDWLRRQLAVLVANRGADREGYKYDKGFRIFLNAPDQQSNVRDLREDLINAGWGTLTASLNDRLQAVCILEAKGIGIRKITSTQKFESLKDISLKVGIMVEDRSQIRDIGVISKGTMSEILKDWGGVQVRYRGFRVFPYGSDDWLGIDYDRGIRRGRPNNELIAFADTLRGVEPERSLLNALSMRSYVGNVIIGEKSHGFEMKANREGFLDSFEMTQLIEFVRFAIDWANILRDFYIRQEELKVFEQAKERFEKLVDRPLDKRKVVDSALDFMNFELKRKAFDFLPTDVKVEVESSLNTATQAIKSYNDSVKVELSHLRLIASTSTLLLIFSHEVKSLLGLFEQSKNSLRAVATKMKGRDKDELLEIGDSFDELNIRLEELLGMTALISESSKSKLKPGRVALKSKIKKVEKVFELVIQNYDIKIDYNEIPNNIQIKDILEAELYSILLNVMSNSIKAVIAKGRYRQIKFTANQNRGYTEIVVRDNGIGLNNERFEEVFIPFISDPDGRLYSNLEKRINPEDNMIVGSGSGLGLGIINEIVKARGGEVHFEKADINWSTQLIIKLP